MQNENFKQANQIVNQIDKLKAVAWQLLQLESSKQLAVQTEDFEDAQKIKNEIERIRRSIEAENRPPVKILPTHQENSSNQGKFGVRDDVPQVLPIRH